MPADVISIKKHGSEVQFATLFALVDGEAEVLEAKAEMQGSALKSVNFKLGSVMERIKMPEEQEMKSHGFDHESY